MDDLPAFATCSEHVRCLDIGHALVLVDYRTGGVRMLRPPASAQWEATSRTGVLDAIDPALVRPLLALGLLTPTREPAPWPPALRAVPTEAGWGSAEHRAAADRPLGGTRARTLTAAAAALAVAFAVTRCGRRGMWRTVTLLSAVCARAVRPATSEQAAGAVNAVRRAGWYSPGRTACLEESVAAVLLLSARRLGVRWCHGVASDPIRLHAWVQTVDGADVAEPFSTRAYTPVLTIGGRHHQPRRPD
ncbi:lasso peptide biosynthesis B2 protein [Actinacidiphila sp. bgisy145]|uniref:lasso peptide biosynthesis B2 protein n=1 Tax=Actinacidiphila sp. bgisy145 TaxID=3413792 RepID=UPI003EBB6C73